MGLLLTLHYELKDMQSAVGQKVMIWKRYYTRHGVMYHILSSNSASFASLRSMYSLAAGKQATVFQRKHQVSFIFPSQQIRQGRLAHAFIVALRQVQVVAPTRSSRDSESVPHEQGLVINQRTIQ